jgi:hypothetical protein
MDAADVFIELNDFLKSKESELQFDMALFQTDYDRVQDIIKEIRKNGLEETKEQKTLAAKVSLFGHELKGKTIMLGLWRDKINELLNQMEDV